MTARQVESRKVGGRSADEDGSALVTVLILVAIITTLAGLVLGLAVLRHRYVQSDVHRMQARYAAEAGVYRALAHAGDDLEPFDDVVEVPTEAGGAAACSVRVEAFGAFARVQSAATVGQQTVHLQALAARRPPGGTRHAILFGDDRSSLTLTGATTVTGSVLTGLRGLETSSLRGKRFTGRHDGMVERDPQVALPDYDDRPYRDLLAQADDWIRRPPDGARESWETPASPARLDGRAAFYADGALALSSGDADLLAEPALIVAAGDLTVEGPLDLAPGSILVAGRTLRVSGRVTGDDVLLVGRQGVFLGGGVDASAQVVSRQQIFASGSAHLRYPSVAYVADPEGRIRLDGTAQVDGWVLFPNRKEKRTSRESEVVIGETARVRGVLYNAGTTEASGTVHGTVMARRFGFYKSPTYYVNWLRDVTVDRTARPPSLVAPYGFEGNDPPEVIQWKEKAG